MARLIAFLAIIFFVSTAHSAPAFPIIVQQLTPCITFMKSLTQDPSVLCCNGARDLSNTVHSNQDRREICMCLKDALSRIGNYEPSKLPSVPKKCGRKLDLPPIDKNYDCSKQAYINCHIMRVSLGY